MNLIEILVCIERMRDTIKYASLLGRLDYLMGSANGVHSINNYSGAGFGNLRMNRR